MIETITKLYDSFNIDQERYESLAKFTKNIPYLAAQIQSL